MSVNNDNAVRGLPQVRTPKLNVTIFPLGLVLLSHGWRWNGDIASCSAAFHLTRPFCDHMRGWRVFW
jgi:metal-sulfur cluster biosynthetic enzyme